MEEIVIPALRAFRPDLVVVAAGFDAMGGERPYGNTKLTQYWYGWCAASLQELGLPLVLNLEGGYTPGNVVAGVEQVILALKGAKQGGEFLADMHRAHAKACGGGVPFAPRAAHVCRMAEATQTRKAAIQNQSFALRIA